VLPKSGILDFFKQRGEEPFDDEAASRVARHPLACMSKSSSSLTGPFVAPCRATDFVVENFETRHRVRVGLVAEDEIAHLLVRHPFHLLRAEP